MDNSKIKYEFDYERKYKSFIEKPYDERALISVQEMVDFYAEDDDMKTAMLETLNQTAS